MRQSEQDFNAKQLNTVLKGAKFMSARVDREDGEEDLLVLVFERTIGGQLTEFELAVQSDPEGNGPGWIECRHVLEVIETTTKNKKKR